MRVLIVDDQEFIRRGIRAVLSDAEDIVVCGEATEGREAIALAQKLRPDIIVMDISMPILDGLEATREIRRTLPQIRVLTLSQYDIPDVVRGALAAGAAAHVSKIVVWTQLVSTLRRVHLGETSLILDPEDASLTEAARRRATLEQALRDSEERFRCTFDVTAIAIGHVAENGRWLRVNQKLCELTGYTREELQTLNFQGLTHPDDLARDLSRTLQIVSGEIDHYSIDMRYLCKDRGIAWVRQDVHAVRDANRNLKYCIRVAEDTAAKREAAEKLARAQRDFQIASAHLELLDSRTPIALSRCSRDFRYLWVNRNFAQWLRLSSERIVGYSIRDVLGKPAFDALRHYFDQVLTGTSVTYEQETVFKGIGKRRVSAAYTPTRDSDGVPDGWLSLIQDVTVPGPTHQVSI